MILCIAHLWWTQRANLVVQMLLAYEFVHSYYHRYADLIVLQPRLIIGICLALLM